MSYAFFRHRTKRDFYCAVPLGAAAPAVVQNDRWERLESAEPRPDGLDEPEARYAIAGQGFCSFRTGRPLVYAALERCAVTSLPVMSGRIQRVLDGLDTRLGIIQMPKAIPVATVWVKSGLGSAGRAPQVRGVWPVTVRPSRPERTPLRGGTDK